MAHPRARAGGWRRLGAGIGGCAQLDPVQDAVAIPVGIPLGAVRVPYQGGDVAIGRREVRGTRIGGVAVFLDIEPPVAIRVLGGIVPVTGIEPVGDLPDVSHAVGIEVVLVVKIGADVEAQVVFLHIGQIIAISIPERDWFHANETVKGGKACRVIFPTDAPDFTRMGGIWKEKREKFSCEKFHKLIVRHLRGVMGGGRAAKGEARRSVVR